MDRRLLVALLAALLLGGVVAAGCSGDAGDPDGGAVTAETTTVFTDTAPMTAAGVFDRIPELVADVQPSVVAVLVSSAAGGGEGSGVVWSEDGIVVTNQHVVEGAQNVTVQLASGARLEARVRAGDELSDLAVLQVDSDGLQPARFAESLPVVGELAIALGNPLGFEQTVTQGIVSGLGRSLPAGGPSGALVDLVQTDAAISPGNSGGALVNGDGEVMGINVAYVPPTGGAVALGFAIPALTVRDVVEQLLEDGRATHAYLGVRMAPLTATPAGRTGVLVVDVEPGSPAARAGVRAGDVIVSAAGSRVEGLEDLLAALRRRAPGDELSLGVVRDGDERDFTVTLGTRPEST